MIGQMQRHDAFQIEVGTILFQKPLSLTVILTDKGGIW
jgi:hypothetical protein